METTTIINEIIENGYSLTDDLNEAIYILSDGTLISGDFDYGMRGTDHRMIECIIDGDRYDNDFWDKVHDLEIIRLVPETGIALIAATQTLTKKQMNLLSDSSYKVEKY